MYDVTFALAIILGAGFFIAKLGQLVRLPSVTGYILAGVLLGPSALNLVSEETITEKLGHFTQIALMLIAFGIGEHLEISRLKRSLKSVGLIGISETSGAFLFVMLGTFFVARVSGVGESGRTLQDYAVLALLFGAVSVATAPAATLHVMREMKAAGPLTTTLMAIVAVDDGLAIIFFGIAMSAARQIVGAGGGSMAVAIISSMTEIVASLMLGIITGLIIDFVIHRLNRLDEVLTVGLSLLLLCGETARLAHFSPLLAGMAVGFTIVNRDRRDVRLFRVINRFEPPIYVLFFTLAGAHLDLSALIIAGWVGLVYFLLRALGKLAGCSFGGRLAAAPEKVVRYLGLALIPQAGVAIGLIFLIRGDAVLGSYASIIIPVVLGSVVLSELTGPVCARIAVEKAGEASVGCGVVRPSGPAILPKGFRPVEMNRIELIPWNWTPLEPAENSYGQVIFGLSHTKTGPSLARFTTLLAHYYCGTPTAVHVLSPQNETEAEAMQSKTRELTQKVACEVESLGYSADVKVITHENVAKGILSAANSQKTWAIVLGHPHKSTSHEFNRIVDAVAKDAPCQVIMVRLCGVLHTERILVPVVDLKNLKLLGHVIRALCGAGKHIITLLAMVQSDALHEEIKEAEELLVDWVQKEHLIPHVRCRAIATEARVEAIVQEAHDHDVTVMAASQMHGLRRIFFGSLAEDVAQNCRKPMLIIHG
ncbi:universal stress family protein [delta proteobacterium NaphS2]|nr:universal stress family protein [delta proteobacterium NaphS2]